MYRVEIATQDDLNRWDEIISRCPYSEALHTIEWRNALSACFKQLEPLYFVIRDNEDGIVGALPCFVFRPIPFSRALLSMPWTLPGGPLILPGTGAADAVTSACRKLDEVSHERRLSETTIVLPPYFGNNDINDALMSAGYTKGLAQFTHILPLENGYEWIWKSYNKRVRGAVRKALKLGVAVRETEDASDMICFYKLYLSLMKRFNSTPKPLSLLKYLQTSPIARLVIAQLGDRIIAGLLFLHFNSRVRLWCEASDPDFLGYRPNNAVIDYIIRWSCRHGYKAVDFGASPPGNKGLVAFKEEWGAKKAWLDTFTKLHSSWRKKLWTVSEPSLRRAYAAIQRFRA